MPVQGQAELRWDSHPRLTWDDYKGTPDAGSPFDAVTDTGFIVPTYTYGYKYTPTETGWKAEAKTTSVSGGDAYMDPSKSWVKPDAKTDDLLSHEQGHYDISEAASRSLNNKLSDLSTEATGTTKEEARSKAENAYKAKVDEIIKETQDWWDRTQGDYDSETEHGRNKDKQREWIRRIAGWLGLPRFMIPEFPFGTISAVLAIFIALIVFSFTRKKGRFNQPLDQTLRDGRSSLHPETNMKKSPKNT